MKFLNLTGAEYVQYMRPLVYKWTRGSEQLYIGKSAYGLGRILNPHHHVLNKHDLVQPDDMIEIAFPEDIHRMEWEMIRDLQPTYNIRSKWKMK